jgi:GcrA cell cycle regulator
MNWNAAAIDKLRTLWAGPHSAAEIGHLMGITKNAVVGKAHRLGLPARPSPIRERAERAPPPRAPRQTLPPVLAGRPERVLGVAGQIMPGAVTAGSEEAMRRGRLSTLKRRENADRRIVGRSDSMLPKPLAEVEFQRLSKPCMWPIGEPRTKDFRYCEAAGVPGKSYCAHHLALSRPRVAREVEAA